MYRMKLWDEDKWNIHSGSYNSSKYGGFSKDEKKDDKKYGEQKYGQREKDVASDYMRKEDAREKDENKNQEIFDNLDEEKKEQPIKEEEIPFKAAKQLFDEKRRETKKIKIEKKGDVKNIEEAVKKAIEEEKRVIILDN